MSRRKAGQPKALKPSTITREAAKAQMVSIASHAQRLTLDGMWRAALRVAPALSVNEFTEDAITAMRSELDRLEHQWGMHS